MLSPGLPVVLASASPRRAELLRGLNWSFDVAAPNVDESGKDGESPEEFCLRLAHDKAAIAACSRGDALVIGADTAVVVNGLVLGKPTDFSDNMRMLALLSGRQHTVMTGLSVFLRGRSRGAVERTLVRFRELDGAMIRAYAETGEGLDKAGGYAIQGRGALLVSSIEGDYFNVVGLPLCRLWTMIEEVMGQSRETWLPK
ncbi:MAG: Maf family protein [Synergistaceae bacterium]|jgi:septum formation protein|nr:Maf family protein [Synergistaceae bacterium]